MKKKIVILSILLLCIFFILYKLFYNNPNYSPISNCEAQSSWFPHSKTLSPVENDGSKFVTNCDFHQWSWQKFLYLTRTDSNGKLKFENLIQVNNHMSPIGATIVLDDVTQAGTSSTLYDSNNKPIYYSIHVNASMYKFTNKYVKLFVDSCRVNKDSISQVKLHKLGLDTLTYPVGSFEVKTSWILASSLKKDSVDYYITNGKMKSTGVSTRIALLGMHIVGRVINHPEFIWATYEHSNLAPIVKWPTNHKKSDTIPDSTQVLSKKQHLFYSKGLRMNECCINPPKKTNQSFNNIFSLFEHGTQPYYAGITKEAKKQDLDNLDNIRSINKSVKNKLDKEKGIWKNYSYTGSVWIDPKVSKLKPGNSSIGALNAKNLRGSRAISNVTMETYAQFDNPTTSRSLFTPSNSMNCFGCHGTADFHLNQGKNKNGSANYNLALSHLFRNKLDTIMKIKKDKK
ncbi:hypothetical protein [Flavobacterium sp. K5-23]|uniref:hypothetical protein n=1 Tax=Flavobacterium sp. K5-23 TaxID=2746225 RepID=UPI00200D9342|nr:hypothetical protein [Flavobacterium sp. K5-23]UQD56037.1 hypothetical protein FLAK523_06415 [Flavobacterium sp. K5-23]